MEAVNNLDDDGNAMMNLMLRESIGLELQMMRAVMIVRMRDPPAWMCPAPRVDHATKAILTSDDPCDQERPSLSTSHKYRVHYCQENSL